MNGVEEEEAEEQEEEDLGKEEEKIRVKLTYLALTS
jgi:hypothetical protein